MDSAMGIPPGGNQTLRYCVEIHNSSSAVLFSATVDHPADMVEAPNLPACETLTVSVTVKNLLQSSTTSSQEFMIMESGESGGDNGTVRTLCLWMVHAYTPTYVCMYILYSTCLHLIHDAWYWLSINLSRHWEQRKCLCVKRKRVVKCNSLGLIRRCVDKSTGMKPLSKALSWWNATL